MARQQVITYPCNEEQNAVAAIAGDGRMAYKIKFSIQSAILRCCPIASSRLREAFPFASYDL